MVLLFMRFALSAERLSVCVETTEGPHQVPLTHSHLTPPCAERRRVRRFFRPEASVTTPGIGGAKGSTANLRHWPEAGHAVGDHHADRAALFALHADAMRQRVRLASIQKCA